MLICQSLTRLTKGSGEFKGRRPVATDVLNSSKPCQQYTILGVCSVASHPPPNRCESLIRPATELERLKDVSNELADAPRRTRRNEEYNPEMFCNLSGHHTRSATTGWLRKELAKASVNLA